MKLLVICGPTAMGKTSLALRLAKLFNGELISADSRQVYKGMDIGTGKDLPVTVKCQMSNVKCFGKRICYYKINGVRVWGYDLVEPTEEFSVAQYVGIAQEILENIYSRGKLPILVGGSGFYITAVVDGIPTAIVPKSLSLREKCKNKSVEELQEIFGKLDPLKLASMNKSDWKNPRRLVRAIEIAEYKSKYKFKYEKKNYDVLFIGLTAPRERLNDKITVRVEKRLRLGFEDEICRLLTQSVSWDSQVMQSLGYKQWKEYFKSLDRNSGWKKGSSKGVRLTKSTEKSKAIENWKRAEIQYAKRQMTWFKKDKRINWFDITQKNWQINIEKLVNKWYK